MRKIIFLLIISFQTLFAQEKPCEIDYEEKTDSTYIKKTKDCLIQEKIFGDSRELFIISLINNNGILMLNLQIIQKSTLFLPTFCFDKKSKIHFQLENGKIITLVNFSEENCSTLTYEEESKGNIRILSNYFFFAKDNYEDLKKSPISLMRIKFATETRDLVFKKEMISEITQVKTNPSTYFIDYLKCVE